MKKFLVLFIFIFTSCGVILINENNYRSLTVSEKRKIKPYKDFLLYSNSATEQNNYLYEINTNNIKTHLKKQKYTWIHLWRPFCSADYCQNIDYFSVLEDKFKNKGLRLLLISETYDIGAITTILEENKFKKQVYILQDAYYGHKIMKNRKQFIQEINNNNLKISKYGFDNYFFKDTLLIYSANVINKQIIDSLITVSE